MNEIPKPGERYRHFKNKLYQIVAIARHSETEEQMVVYQALYGDYGVWVRPLSMFMEKVDREKYPDAAQEYRFEKVTDSPEPAGEMPRQEEQGREETEEEANPYLLKFLDTDSVDERLALLLQMRGKVGKRELDSLCFCLDVQPGDVSPDEQLDLLRQTLRMQQKYDAARLRRG